MPLTLYIGKIPAALPDDLLQRVLECCGKVQKWSRPADATHALKPFGFCTFEHGISALRCRSVVAKLDLSPVCPSPDGEPVLLQVKAGTKETAALDSLALSEDRDRSAGDPLAKGEDAAVADRVQSVLRRRGGEGQVAEPDAGPAVSILDLDDMERETLVLGEIEKFRIRQAHRDKEVDEQRKARLRLRIEQLKDRQRIDRDKPQEVPCPPAAEKPPAPPKEKERAREREREREESAREQEAKRRRKQQVLEMLAEEAGMPLSSFVPAEEVSVAAPAAPALPAISLQPFKQPSKQPPRPSVSAPLFQAAEEAAPSLRPLVPLDITEEERRAAREYQTSGEDGESAAGTAQSRRQPLSHDEIKLRQKQIVDRIPTQRKELFQCAVDWEAVDRHRIVEGVMRSWVVKKIVEYLGEEEATLTDFILSKLSSRSSPDSLLTELAAVLDDDAEQFVIKMWRMLIFSALKTHVV